MIKQSRLSLLFLLSVFSFNSLTAQTMDIVINEFLAANSTTNVDPDFSNYSDWIELYNSTGSPVDIGGYFLTDDLSNPGKWQIPAATILNANSYLLVWADNENSGLHTNFGLSRSGEEIGLFNRDTVRIDSIRYGVQQDDISYGRENQNRDQWSFYNPPTPGLVNNPGNIVAATPIPLLSLQGGFYSGPQSLSIQNADILDVYFTTDGSTPDDQSQLYTVPISITTTTPMRAIAYDTGKPPSEIVTQTYFIDEPVNLKIISLVTDADNFFSDETGIYITGTNGIGGYCDAAIRNVKQDWERPVNIEFYELNGDQGLNQMAGIKIFGGCSRHRYPQKSLALYARSEYGNGTFNYKLFEEKNIENLETFILRSSADDQVSTMMRDATGQQLLIKTMDADYQAYQPVVVYINGAYWGIHNLREKVNEHFIENNFNVNPADVNILESNGNVSHGTNAGYNDLVNYVNSNNMASPANFEYVKTQMDVDQYVDYMIGHIYLAERDWPGNNIKFWRANSGEYDRWRWINFDLDQTLAYGWREEDMIFKTTTDQGPGWPNPEWSTRLFRNLLENQEFKNQFINSYAWHMHSTFDSSRVIGIIDSLADRLTPEIPRHIERWGGQLDPDALETWIPATFNSMEEWQGNIEAMRAFARERQQYTVQNFINHFALSGASQLQMNSNITEAAVLRIINKRVRSGFSGLFFNDIPVKIQATPLLGYLFSHWEVESAGSNFNITTTEIDFVLTEDTQLTAIFTIDTAQTANTVIINEINYKSASAFDSGDWIEIYNNSGSLIDMTNWVLTDSQNDSFLFPQNYLFQPETYLVITRDSTSFKTNYPDVENVSGDFGFGLSSTGEQINIINSGGQIVDIVAYGVINPWPSIADESGRTLELSAIDSDNSLGQNWHASSIQYGTPGEANSEPLSIDNYNPLNAARFELLNNYPNPFNPTTTLQYTVEQRTRVTLAVYDINGKKLQTLVNGYKEAGNYSIIFNGENLASGIYIYTLRAGEYSEIKKMLLIK